MSKVSDLAETPFPEHTEKGGPGARNFTPRFVLFGYVVPRTAIAQFATEPQWQTEHFFRQTQPVRTPDCGVISDFCQRELLKSGTFRRSWTSTW